ncbi:MAG: CDP-alcohol phosphatidyltransferase family protein [Planctomycetota bacterium]
MILTPPQQQEKEVEPRPGRLIGISLLPATMTLGNLLCGFLAIFACLLAVRAEYAQVYNVQPRVFFPRLEQLFPTHVAAGAYLIVLAMIFDALDGRLARITRRTSEFGAQLDSISDIVSFGIAPAVLFITLLVRPFAVESPEVPDVTPLQFRIGMACALVYVVCAAIRLARYNVENIQSESAQSAFSGLPSPGAAAAVIALLALHEHLRHTGFAGWGVDWANVSRWLIALTAFSVGLLMISRLDYVHVFNVYVRRKRPPTHLLWLIVILVGAWYSFELLLVALAFAYVLSGLILNIIRRGHPVDRATDIP